MRCQSRWPGGKPLLAHDWVRRLQHFSAQEARVQRALERAAAPVFRKQGKPPMPRSTVLKRVVAKDEVAARPRDAELDAFLQLDLS